MINKIMETVACLVKNRRFLWREMCFGYYIDSILYKFQEHYKYKLELEQCKK